MFKLHPERKAKAKWHKLLNNGYRYALLDLSGDIKAAARYEYELKMKKIHNPTWKQILIEEQLN